MDNEPLGLDGIESGEHWTRRLGFRVDLGCGEDRVAIVKGLGEHLASRRPLEHHFSGGGGVRVLIAAIDLFHQTGGGQTFYRSLIRENPQVEFVYLTIQETERARRPPNAHCVEYRYWHTLMDERDCDGLAGWSEPFRAARNLAFSLAGEEFDFVDVPDFMPFGMFLRPACEEYGVRYGGMAVSLHGTISLAERLNWRTHRSAVQLERLAAAEETQFRVADARYGISLPYIAYWREKTGLESAYVDPLFLVKSRIATTTMGSSDPPDLQFIGRTEKWKGPEVFVDLVWGLPRQLYGKARLIGPSPAKMDDVSRLLAEVAFNRKLDVSLEPTKSSDEVAALFGTRSITVLPSRWDTLNLVGLESLFSGCPTAIGNGAGLCHYLRSRFPGIPFLEIDPLHAWRSLPELCRVLTNYDAERDRLVSAVEAAEKSAPAPDLRAMYFAGQRRDKRLCEEMRGLYGQLCLEHRAGSRKGVRSLKRCLASIRIARVVYAKSNQAATKLVTAAKAAALAWSVPVIRLVADIRRARALPERSAAEVDRKVDAMTAYGHVGPCGRAEVLSELARLERIRGNDLIAATYELRVVRQGAPKRVDLSQTKATLEKHGFEREAVVADAMFGDHPNPERLERCRSLLDAQRSAHTFKEAVQRAGRASDYAVFHEGRNGAKTRVAVVVSMYNAGQKLGLFLDTLAQQTFFRRNDLELVLVDSASPTEEYAVFRKFFETTSAPVLYVRTTIRETIQAAWNRGIALATSPYLAFLGVDEAMHPECLEKLANELDADGSLDWIQASSVVTETDEVGQFVRDVMCYDRTGFRPELVYLETCYLSWVGALHRRSMYERCGVYDATFRAAGDTEFKGRVLPRIRTKCVPEVLGFFRNYPEERTTQHPRAEIEDLRAWYLHRTRAGVNYAYDGRDPAEAELLLWLTLNYRKSYVKHSSTDIDLAGPIVDFLTDCAPQSAAIELRDDLRRLAQAHCQLDTVPVKSLAGSLRRLASVRSLAGKLRQKHRRWALQRQLAFLEPDYRVFNDNRYEQHCALWRTM